MTEMIINESPVPSAPNGRDPQGNGVRVPRHFTSGGQGPIDGGLFHEYGIEGSGGNFYTDHQSGEVRVTQDSYSRPQVSACFIQSIGDDLMSIFELARNEARVFKYGSGTGTNFSQLRGRMERLSGGGQSSRPSAVLR